MMLLYIRFCIFRGRGNCPIAPPMLAGLTMSIGRIFSRMASSPEAKRSENFVLCS